LEDAGVNATVAQRETRAMREVEKYGGWREWEEIRIQVTLGFENLL
jgi:hypothetical protein